MKKKLFSTPPRLAEYCLRQLSHYHEKFEMLGDIEEFFYDYAEEKGLFFAHCWYWWQTLLAVIKYNILILKWSGIMIKNYLKSQFRNFSRNRGFSLINIIGFSISLAAFILIMLYIKDEMGYDSFHTESNKIYRVAMDFRAKGQSNSLAAVTSPPVAPAILERFPEVEYAVRIQTSESVIKMNNIVYFDDNVYVVEPSFFKIFSFKLKSGDPESVLKEPYTAVITESTARKYFGSENPVGKILILGNKNPFTITGILQDIPQKTHFRFDILLSFVTLEQQAAKDNRDLRTAWLSHSFYTYIKLKNAPPSENLKKGLFNLTADLIADQEKETGFQQKLFLQPVTDIYLKSNLYGELGKSGNIQYLYIFSVIAFFILLIACINFINLSTARSASRSKEVGMRKVVGATRKQLIFQFMSEAVLTAYISMIIALVFAIAGIPFLSSITGKAYIFHPSLKIVSGVLILPAVIGLVAGSYPAVCLSAFRPVETLKKMTDRGKKGRVFRSILVVFQFSLSILFISGTLIVLNQVRFMKNTSLGFKMDRIIVFPMQGTLESVDKFETLKKELLQQSRIVTVAGSHTVPGKETTSLMMLPEGFSSKEWKTMFINWVGYDYLKTYEIDLAAGRFFNPDLKSDILHTVVINESAARFLGWDTNSAIGKTWEFYGKLKANVIGVIKDYHYRSLHEKIAPMIMHLYPRQFNYISIKVKPGDLRGTIAAIEKIWKNHLPDYQFQYFFLDRDYYKQYKAEEKAETIFIAFTILALIIACLGIFGMALYIIGKRTREIGIRKVLGASLPNLSFILTKEFIVRIIISNIFAWPVAWYAGNKWLQNFAYRSEISISVFFIAGIITLLIALLTISSHVIRSALVNPVNSLRQE